MSEENPFMHVPKVT